MIPAAKAAGIFVACGVLRMVFSGRRFRAADKSRFPAFGEVLADAGYKKKG